MVHSVHTASYITKLHDLTHPLYKYLDTSRHRTPIIHTVCTLIEAFDLNQENSENFIFFIRFQEWRQSKMVAVSSTVIGLYLGVLACKRYVGNSLWCFPQLSYLNTNNNKEYAYKEL